MGSRYLIVDETGSTGTPQSSLKSNSTIIHVTSTNRSGYLKIPSTSPAPFWLEDHEGFGCFLQQPEISADSRAELQRLQPSPLGRSAALQSFP